MQDTHDLLVYVLPAGATVPDGQTAGALEPSQSIPGGHREHEVLISAPFDPAV